MTWILENWQGLVGGGSLTTIVAWIVNRQNNKADLLTKIGGLYDGLFDDIKQSKDELKEQNAELKEIIKGYSKDIQDLRQSQNMLQGQFNDLNIAYTREVEKSLYWMQKYDELDKKYNELMVKHEEVIKQNEHLENLCEGLKTAHNKLQKEFETYKKANK
jgi:chromosome segregation ATPase